MPCFVVLTTLSSGLAISSAQGAPPPARPKYYVQVQEVKQLVSKTCDLREQGKRLLTEQLTKHAEVITQLPGGVPADKAALAKLLQQQGLEGYSLVLRITKCAHSLEPPRPGGTYKVLMVDVELALDAEKIPSGQLARAGEGQAQVGAEVAQVKPSELRQLQSEAAAVATNQAADGFLRSLQPKSGAKRKRKRPRRTR